MYGVDYPTPDGTSIRDYIHVYNLKIAHVLGLKQLLARGWQHLYTLGNDTGYSVQDVLDVARCVAQRQLQARNAPRRKADSPIELAGADQARHELGWTPEFPDLATVIEQAWSWHQRGAQPLTR